MTIMIGPTFLNDFPAICRVMKRAKKEVEELIAAGAAVGELLQTEIGQK